MNARERNLFLINRPRPLGRTAYCIEKWPTLASNAKDSMYGRGISTPNTPMLQVTLSPRDIWRPGASWLWFWGVTRPLICEGPKYRSRSRSWFLLKCHNRVYLRRLICATCAFHRDLSKMYRYLVRHPKRSSKKQTV